MEGKHTYSIDTFSIAALSLCGGSGIVGFGAYSVGVFFVVMAGTRGSGRMT